MPQEHLLDVHVHPITSPSRKTLRTPPQPLLAFRRYRAMLALAGAND